MNSNYKVSFQNDLIVIAVMLDPLNEPELISMNVLHEMN